MKFCSKLLTFLLCLSAFKLFSTPQERDIYLRQLADIYFNPDSSKHFGDESYKEEPLVSFLIELYSADIKSFNQIFEHLILKRQQPDPLAMFILQKKNLIIGDDISPWVRIAFKLCKKIVKNYCKDHRRDKTQIILAPDNIIFILSYALVVGKGRDAEVDPTTFRNRKRRTFGTLSLNLLLPLVKAGAVRSFEDVLDFMSVFKANASHSFAASSSASTSAAAPSSFRNRKRSLNQIKLKN